MTISDKFMDMLKWVLTKLTSARFLIVLALVYTLCKVLLKSLDLMVLNGENEKLFTIYKDLFLVIFGAFIGFVGAAITFYFTRTDRKTGVIEENGNGNGDSK